MQEKFGLIGKTLKHSYSKIIHSYLSEYSYDLVELKKEQLEEFIKNGEYKAFNVTIPYKKEVMQYLDCVDDLAKEIGAVNTVVKKDGKIYGYNTDFFGMNYALDRAGISLNGKKVMILGSGGTSDTARAVAKKGGASEIVIVSRTGQVNYQNYLTHADTDVIINTTPVGMFPDNFSKPISLDGFTRLSGVLDVIYNPNLTALTFDAKQKGVKYSNGLPMLVAQAKKASEYFTGSTIDNQRIEEILNELCKNTLNIVLIGMPGSGKTTLARELSKILDREVLDTDELIVERLGVDIPTVFEQKGEQYFRQVESEILKELGAKTGKIISTGGGVVKNPENLFPLKSNGVIFYVNRAVENLSRDGRPLSKDLESVKKLYQERKDAYENFADYKIDNNKDISLSVKAIMEKL